MRVWHRVRPVHGRREAGDARARGENDHPRPPPPPEPDPRRPDNPRRPAGRRAQQRLSASVGGDGRRPSPRPRQPAALQTLERVAPRRPPCAAAPPPTARRSPSAWPSTMPRWCSWHPGAIARCTGRSSSPSAARARRPAPGDRPALDPLRRRRRAPAHPAAHARLLPRRAGRRIPGGDPRGRPRAPRALAARTPGAALGLMQELTLEVILRAVFGTSDEQLAADIRDTLSVGRSLPRAAAMALAQRDLGPRSPWGAFLRRMAVVDEQLMALIARRRAAGAGGDDILAQLLAAGLDDAELRDHLVTLLAAGHETTAARWPGRSSAWPARRTSSRACAPATRRGSTPWSRRRWHPPGPDRRPAQARRAAARRRPRSPAGVHVAPCIYLVHRREDLYPDARHWRPQRWLGAAPPESFAWIPFGGGVRRCLGAAFATMEMAEVLRIVAERLEVLPRTRAASACAVAASRCSPDAARASCSVMLLRLLRLDRLGRRQRLAVTRLVDGDEREAAGCRRAAWRRRPCSAWR